MYWYVSALRSALGYSTSSHGDKVESDFLFNFQMPCLWRQLDIPPPHKSQFANNKREVKSLMYKYVCVWGWVCVPHRQILMIS